MSPLKVAVKGTALLRRRLVVVALAIATCIVSFPASGYVRYRTQTGLPYAWNASCVGVRAFPRTVANLSTSETQNAIAGAVEAWSAQNPSLASCSFLDLYLTVSPEGDHQPPAQFDGTNNIGFLTDVWCARTTEAASVCYDPAALALTTNFARTSTGEIVDADIEINAVNFVWADLATRTGTDAEQDLQSAVTHEIGHLIGLDHTCDLGTGAETPKDEDGNVLPDCESASTNVRETTMFASGALTDTSKRTLASDDQRGLCEIYALHTDPMRCPTPDPPEGGTDGGVFDAAADRGLTGDGRADTVVDIGPGPHVTSQGCGCAVGGSELQMACFAIAVPLFSSIRRRARTRAN
jgi:hypothetical protein